LAGVSKDVGVWLEYGKLKIEIEMPYSQESKSGSEQNVAWQIEVKK